MSKTFSNMNWWLAVVLIAAGLLRVFLFVQNESRNPLAAIPMVDAALHYETAERIAAGNLLQAEPFERPPGYAYFIGALYALFGPSCRTAAAMQALLGFLGLLLLYRLARRYMNQGPAILAVFFSAFYGPLAFFELKLLPASLSVFLVLLFLNLLSAHLASGGIHRAVLAGLVGGLIILVRPNLVFIPALILLWLFFRRASGSRRGAAALAFGVLAGVAPSFIHNLAAGDGSAFVCKGGGLNFFLGNRKGAQVSFTGDFEGVVDPADLPNAARRRFEAERGAPPRNNAEVERFWAKKGVDEILEDPVAWGMLELRKLKALFSEFEYGVNYSYEAEKDLLGILAFFLVPFALLAALGVGGLFAPPRPENAVSRVPFALTLVGIALSALVFFTYSRFRLPAVPILALLSADALNRSLSFLKSGQGAYLVRTAVPAVLAGAAALLPPGDLARRQVSGGHALVGAAFLRAKDISAAVDSYERAIEADPRSTKARQTLAGILSSRGELARARDLHLAAVDRSPRDPAVLCNASLFFCTASPPYRDPDRALSLAREAAERDPESPLASLCMDLAWQIKGVSKESNKAFQEVREKCRRAPGHLETLVTIYRRIGENRKASILERDGMNREER